MTTEEQETYLNTPEDILLHHEYEKYLETGDAFFPDNLPYEKWKDHREYLLNEMTKWGSD